jgi:hemerythrin-like domain-containing protein
MHIFEALMNDHVKVKELLNELVSLNNEDVEDRNSLIQDIRDELIPHARAEESVFYNSLRALIPDTSEVMHGYKEHMEAEALLRALQVEDKMNIGWKATAEKLKKALEHHIQEEETELFSIARSVLSQEDAKKLGELFVKFKPKYEEEGFVMNTMEMMANLLPPKLSSAIRNLKAS